MTKEKLLSKASKLAEVSARGVDAYRDLLYFFESNICIPKGETLQAKFDGYWTDIFTNNDEYQLRIKPSEPIYEWQWYDIDRNMEVFIVNSGRFMTEDECGELTTFGKMCKFEETKRERK